MNNNIAFSLVRADELLAQLLAEYSASLDAKEVSERAIHLTHEICERLRSVLDRTARRYWEKHIAPSLSIEDGNRAAVYFPISDDQNGFDSTLGRWRWKAVRANHQSVYDFLLNLQPFVKPTNRWLSVLNSLAVQGKHIDLVPQVRNEGRRITVTRGGSSVSWGPGVVFGPGVSIAGVPIDPSTQRIVPTAGVTEELEVWISFMIEEYNVNAAGFCQGACRDIRNIVTQMCEEFSL